MPLHLTKEQKNLDAEIARLLGKNIYRDSKGAWHMRTKASKSLDGTVPHYSTDIKAAIKLVDMDGAWDIKKRFRPHHDDPPGSPGRPTYQVYIFLSDYNEYDDALTNTRRGMSPWCWSLPEAICRAFVFAKEPKKNNDIPQHSKRSEN